MALRKVLLLTYHFPPSGAVAVYRMLGLVRYLPKFGWQPIVVAPPQVPWEPVDASLLDLVPPDTPIERVPFAGGIAGKLIRRIAPEAHWIVKARSACRRMIEAHRPDAVITSSPPGIVHMLGRWVQKRYGLPWIACFRDPWVTNRIDPPWWSWRACVDRRLEQVVMNHATKLIANTPANKANWSKAFPQHAAKMVIITNGFDPQRFPSAGTPRTPGSRLKIVHAGELYAGRDPRPLLDAWQQLNAAKQFSATVEFVGRVTEGIFDLPTEIQRRGLHDAVTAVGQVSYAEALQRMMHADILLLIHAPGSRLGIPAKLYEYLGAGRPIFALTEPDGDIEWALRESKVLHRCAPPRDVGRIREAFLELVNDVRSGRPTVPDREAVLRFTRERMAQRFAECLDAIAPMQGAPRLAPTVTP